MTQCQEVRRELEDHHRRPLTLTMTTRLATRDHAMDQEDIKEDRLSRRSTTTEAHHKATAEMLHQLDHHVATVQDTPQAELDQEPDQDLLQEENLVISTCLIDPATMQETDPSEWTRFVTNHSKSCTIVPTTRSRGTELSVPREVSNIESAETPETSLRQAISETKVNISGGHLPSMNDIKFIKRLKFNNIELL